MTLLLALLFACWLAPTALHIASQVVVARRMHAAAGRVPARTQAGRISVVRPINGLEPDVERCLRSSFELDDPDFELIFCAHSNADPATEIVRALIREFPAIPATLLCGTLEASRNPKLDNMAQSWSVITGDWIVFSDGNTVLPSDYLARNVAAWTERSGAVTAPPSGADPRGFWAEVECAFLNQYHARWYFMAAALGLGYCNGKSMMVRQADLAAAGGIGALGIELAEDVALTKLIRSQRRSVTPIYKPVVQPIGLRSASTVFNRLARWARIRRLGHTAEFTLEVFSTALLPVAAAGLLAHSVGESVSLAVLAQGLLWYGADLAFACSVGFHVSYWTIPASIVRDASIPFIWMYAWFGREFRWGNKIVYGAARDPG